MFEGLIETHEKRRNTWITFPLSVLLHLAIVVIVVVAPLLEAETDLPPIKVINVFMAAPPPPPPPPPPPAKRGSKKGKKRHKQEKAC